MDLRNVLSASVNPMEQILRLRKAKKGQKSPGGSKKRCATSAIGQVGQNAPGTLKLLGQHF